MAAKSLESACEYNRYCLIGRSVSWCFEYKTDTGATQDHDRQVCEDVHRPGRWTEGDMSAARINRRRRYRGPLSLLRTDLAPSAGTFAPA